ncbi:MAG: dTDP-4-dehydrorhamnose 3,5-epimerase family protein [Candidatus Omnitrophota bacterium]
MIEGVLIEELKTFSDDRGKVMRMIRADDPFFKRFGEVYFSTVNPGVIKGWKKHSKMTQHFAVPVGSVKVVLFDDRSSSASKGEVQEVIIGDGNYCLLRIPPQIWYSFKASGKSPAMIANCTDIVHDPKETVTTAIDDNKIPYKWK